MSLAKQIEEQYLADEELDVQNAVKKVLDNELETYEENIEEKIQSQISVSLTDMGRLELAQELRNKL